MGEVAALAIRDGSGGEVEQGSWAVRTRRPTLHARLITGAWKPEILRGWRASESQGLVDNMHGSWWSSWRDAMREVGG